MNFREFNFRSSLALRKYFNNEIFPNYGMLCMSMWQWESQESNILIALLGQGYLQPGTCSATVDCDSI